MVAVDNEPTLIRLQASRNFDGQYLDDVESGYSVLTSDLLKHFVCLDDPEKDLQDIVNIKFGEGITLLIPIRKENHNKYVASFGFSGSLPISENQYKKWTESVPDHAHGCIVP